MENKFASPIETRTTYIQIRVSLFEKAVIEAKARKAGMKVSEFIRYCTMTNKDFGKEGEE